MDTSFVKIAKHLVASIGNDAQHINYIVSQIEGTDNTKGDILQCVGNYFCQIDKDHDNKINTVNIFQEALKYYEKTNSYDGLTSCYNNIGLIYKILVDTKKRMS